MKRTLISVLVPLLALGLYLGGRALYFQPKFITGDRAPDFSAELIDGSDFSLSDLRGSYVLLDFWASWCGPCRKENPEIVQLHKEFSETVFRDGRGLKIVNIGVEKREASWRSAIKKDRLDWPWHILDLAENTRFIDSPIAKEYRVREVPTKFLLNPAGRILAVNPEPDDIRAILESRK